MSQMSKSGGTITNSDIPEVNSFSVNSVQFFPLMVKHYNDICEYRKIYITSDSSEMMYDVKLYGYNRNNNGIVKFAVELDNNNRINTTNGQEFTENITKEPCGIHKYEFVEVLPENAIVSGTIAGGFGHLYNYISIPIWLQYSFSEVGSNNINDVFVLGVKFKTSLNSNTYITKEIELYHSRIDGLVGIRKINRILNNPLYVELSFALKEMADFGTSNQYGYYAVYIDNNFVAECRGVSSVPVRIRNSYIPFDVKVLFLPYGGYKVTMPELDSVYKSRIKIVFLGKKAEYSDIRKHVLSFDDNFAGEVRISNNVGSGKNIETCTVEV
jgi:hypothetical protein